MPNDDDQAVAQRELMRRPDVKEWLDRVAPLCGKYIGDNEATCLQLTCIRLRGHPGLCDNVRGDNE